MAGTGRTGSYLPERSAICLYNGTWQSKNNRKESESFEKRKWTSYWNEIHASFSAAPALQAAIDTANIAFAPISACKIPHTYYIQINMFGYHIICIMDAWPISL